jgi:hypothetical protein
MTERITGFIPAAANTYAINRIRDEYDIVTLYLEPVIAWDLSDPDFITPVGLAGKLSADEGLLFPDGLVYDFDGILKGTLDAFAGKLNLAIDDVDLYIKTSKSDKANEPLRIKINWNIGKN